MGKWRGSLLPFLWFGAQRLHGELPRPLRQRPGMIEVLSRGKAWGKFGGAFGGGRAASCPPKPVQEVVVTMPGRAGRQSYGTGGLEKMLSFPSENGEFGLGVSLWANSKAKNNPNLLRDTDWGCSDSKPREQFHRTPNSLNLGLAESQRSTQSVGQWRKGDLFLPFF